MSLRLISLVSVSALAMAAGCIDPGGAELEGESVSTAAAAVTDAELESAIPVASTTLARVVLSIGDIVFRSSLEQDPNGTASAPTITMLEQARPDSAGKLALLSGDRSPLETYLLVTPSSTPVPRLLLSTEPSQAIRDRAAGRAIVEQLTAPITGLPALALAAATQPLAAAASYCTGGSSASWAADVCTLTNWDVDFCHNGTWYSVTDEVGSSNKKRKSRGYTLGCGANSRVRHYYKLWGVWHKPIDETLPSNQIWRTTQNGNWALQRAITHSRTASGFVRASSHFNVPF